jgi:hypothetical protein
VTRDGRRITVDTTPDGDGLVSHAGSALLASVADRVGLTRARRASAVGYVSEAAAMIPAALSAT